MLIVSNQLMVEDITKCHPADTVIPLQEYNPNKSLFIIPLVLQLDEIYISSPYESPFQQGYLFRFGQSIYDRVTQELTGTVNTNLDMACFGEVMHSFSFGNYSITLMVVCLDEEGTVFVLNFKQVDCSEDYS